MTASAERGLRPEQVAEIIVAPPERGAARRGTGYLFAPGKVLTAAHVVDGASAVRVRFQADRPGERTVAAEVLYRHDAVDVAVLALPAEPVTDVVPAGFGRIGDQDAVLPCTTMGYPRFKLRTDDDGSRFRDAEHIRTSCAVLSNRREGTLDLTVPSPPAEDPDPERDPWEGMSGAAVFGNGRLVGIVTRRHRGDGPGRVAAHRVDRWAEALPEAELAALERALGCGLTPEALPDAIPATTFDLIQEAYRTQLADDFAPEELKDRAAELRELVAFCSGPEQYLMLQGRPWAGKTSLAAWFALHPPRGVVPVWFFVTSRNARQSDSDAFTGALIDQLAAIAGHEPAGHHSPAARDGLRGLLLRKAAERVAQYGGTLLLVVDGLDEDQSLTADGNGPSIASLLPRRPPPNIRVLVTGRPSPGLPLDVRDEHPLRHCRVLELAATAAARHIEYQAKLDLRRALSGDRLQIDLVGLLTAARGTLTVDDLRELTGAQAHELRRRLGSAFGRILRERGGFDDSGGDVSLYVSGRGFLFAHETLLAAAQEELGPDLDTYAGRLHTWAEAYAEKGWPADTPLYLLQPYGRLAAQLQDTRRTCALATDARRRDRLREVTGSDAACLAEIAAARRVVHRTAPDDLGQLAALAAVADLISRRNESLHPDIPAVYARLGRVRHAIGLARSVFDPLNRARALAGVAGVLAGTGDRRAVGLAREALELTRKSVERYRWPHGEEILDAALGRLAVLLMRTGDEAQALRRLGELRLPDTLPGVAAHTMAARAARDPRCAARLLGRAEELARRITEVPDRVHALGLTAGAWTAHGDTSRAAVLYDAVVALAEEHAHDLGSVPAAAAEVLHPVRPHQARTMVRLALEVTDDTRRSRPDDREAAYEAVAALAATGRASEAEELRKGLRRWAEPSRDTRPTMAAVRAREGRAAEAWQELQDFWEFQEPAEEDDFSARVVELLVAAGAADDLETLLLTGTDTWWWWGVAGALTALADHFADSDPARALRLLHRAEWGNHLRGGTDQAYGWMDDLPQDERLAALAGALAAAGAPDDAERLVEAIRTHDMRAFAYAAASLALVGTDTSRALRFARQADRTAELSGGWDDVVRAGVLMAVVQALASTGQGQRALQVARRLHKGWGDTFYLDQAHALVAASVWPYDPGTAERLVDDLLGDSRDTSSDSVRALLGLLAATVPHDAGRAARVRALLDGFDGNDLAERDHEDRALLALRTAATDPDSARRHLDRLASEDRHSRSYRSAVMAALAYTVLGDHAAAHAVSRGSGLDEELTSAAFAALAGHAACAPVDPGGLIGGGGGIRVSLARRLAALLHPPAAGPDLARTRALLAEALTPDGWHHAVPVLAALAPEAVRRAGDVVSAHIGLADD
ncbi:trypsin-like peptidase domain-containing protein [Streptomyces sp. ISL-22]|uniref:trypsin-like peptidase domain-containing protein n=1 Tax=unclassified Streptomyces TaxID=2593676 RepID=UPI001BE4FEDB|nr:MULTISPECIES: trypsin-like peptidase domain-containing protein [unclassified Streptomyces]MBT2418225.1 trypsin-like peptidase domain-containing protein [Streptomyces sp. ISL-24]MBT2431573.1 trypsin-like peptidase domain-containing protein [Streptomyces sp. ISL-22]